jgi:hypothetical protein
VLKLLAGTVASDWCTIVDLREEPVEFASGSGSARAEPQSSAGVRRVFRLTIAGVKGFAGTGEGAVTVDDVKNKLGAWCKK